MIARARVDLAAVVVLARSFAAAHGVHRVARFPISISEPDLLPYFETLLLARLEPLLVDVCAVCGAQVREVDVLFVGVEADCCVLARAQLALQLHIGIPAPPQHYVCSAIELDRGRALSGACTSGLETRVGFSDAHVPRKPKGDRVRGSGCPEDDTTKYACIHLHLTAWYSAQLERIVRRRPYPVRLP
jgi:hypothetical protein